MDKKFTPVTGGIADLSGFTVQTSVYVKPAGTIYQMNHILLMSPFNDIIWDNTWKQIVANERREAGSFLENLLLDTYLKFGLT